MAQYQEHFECDVCNRGFTRKYNLRTHITNCHMNSNCYCDICDTSFSSSKGLQKHLSRGHNRHLQGYPECDICGRIFTRKQNIMSHMLTVHLQGCGRRITCHLCQKTFTTERNLKRHLNQLHNPDAQYPTCDDCNKVFKGKHSLLAHIQTAHGFAEKVVAKCDLCEKEYTNSRSLKRHIEMYHGERNEYRCHLCPKIYTSNQSLRRHTKSIHNTDNVKPLKCEMCSVVFYEERSYAVHISNCKQENYNWNPILGYDSTCQTCGVCFDREPNLRQHVKDEHPFNIFYEYCRDFLLKQEAKNENLNSKRQNESYYNCEYCSTVFTNVYDLKEHMRSKHDIDYSLCSCNVCFNKFYSKEGLKEHKKHCLPPPGVNNCDYCEKLFTDMSSLEFHKRIFHPQIPDSDAEEYDRNNYKCEHCNRVYFSDRSLKHHIKLKHTTDEMVECGFCGKICNNKYYLASHIKIVHTEQALSKCDYCDKEFKSKRNIRRHIEYTHLGMQRYKCIECETLFKEKRSLRKHVRIKHPNSTMFPQCHICKKRFESAKSCKIHLKLVHSYNMNTHPCDLCSVSFTSVESLKIHLQENHLAEDEIYKCEECNLVFKGQENFDTHNETYHINLDPNVKKKLLPRCIICIKDFSTRKTLKRHIKKFHHDFDIEELANYGTRQGNFNVSCEECLKKFHDGQYTNIYEKIKHLKDSVVFSCEYCGSSYNVLEYTIQKHRMFNFDETKGKMILSELCTAEISGEEEEMDYSFYQDRFHEEQKYIKSEPIDDIKTEPMSP